MPGEASRRLADGDRCLVVRSQRGMPGTGGGPRVNAAGVFLRTGIAKASCRSCPMPAMHESSGILGAASQVASSKAGHRAARWSGASGQSICTGCAPHSLRLKINDPAVPQLEPVDVLRLESPCASGPPRGAPPLSGIVWVSAPGNAARLPQLAAPREPALWDLHHVAAYVGHHQPVGAGLRRTNITPCKGANRTCREVITRRSCARRSRRSARPRARTRCGHH
jgi:hypothetical protein